MIRRMTTKGPDIARQLRSVIDRLNAASQRRPEHLQGREPQLVAVSKTKPASMIIEAYDSGQRHFGENYIQELLEKSNNPEILQSCADVKWHFIGHLQKNKASKVTSIPGLHMVETVDSEKLALILNKSWGKEFPDAPLSIMLQINTSGEENKSGVDPSQVKEMAVCIRDNCPHLQLAGLMTVGSVDSSISSEKNPDFQRLVECRKMASEALGVAELDLELSMGMSHDFEHAIEIGSTNIRVGSTIFGARQYPPKQDDVAASGSSSLNSSTAQQAAAPSGEPVNQCVAEDSEVTAELNDLSLAS